MAHTFQPSTYSDISALARPNVSAGQVVGRTTLAVLTGGASEATRLAVDFVKKKDKKYADAMAKAELWEQRYNKCAKKRRDKGKTVYPDNPGKGPFRDDCKEKHVQWKKHLNKAARLAKELQEKLEKKGQLDNKTKQQLLRAQGLPNEVAEEEYQQALDRPRKGGGGRRTQDNTDLKRDIMNAALEPDLAAETIEGTEGSIWPWVIGAGAVVVLGGAGYLFYTREG